MTTHTSKADDRRSLGAKGEAIAAATLQQAGLTIIDRNWRCAAGEIDLVARDGETLVFVEVKTRRGRAYGAPEEALTPRKAQKLLQLGAQYVYENALGDINWRIDLVAIELDARGLLLRCNHVRNAVLGW